MTETEVLYNVTVSEAQEARDKADETYHDALQIYTETESIRITQVNVDVLNEQSNQIKSEVSVANKILSVSLSLCLCLCLSVCLSVSLSHPV